MGGTAPVLIIYQLKCLVHVDQVVNLYAYFLGPMAVAENHHAAPDEPPHCQNHP
jgi:hypothetical protein